MLRLALIESGHCAEQYDRVAPRIRNGRFTAIVGRDARTTARSIGAEIWADDFDQLLADHGTEFDAVVLHSPGRFQERHCQRAAEAGKHVLADIPLALSKDAALKIISSCREAGVCLMVAQPSRFSPSLRTVKESLAAGRLGVAGLVRMHSWRAAENGSGQTGAEDAEHVTKTRSLLSGVAREIDLVCWLFGGLPNLVYALERNTSPQPQNLEYVQLHLGFAGGGMALIDYSQTLPGGDSYFSLSLIGSTGAAYADDHHNMQLLYGGGHPSALEAGEGDTHLLVQLQEFISSIEEHREPLVTGADAVAVIEVAEAAAASLSTRQAAQPGAEDSTGRTGS